MTSRFILNKVFCLIVDVMVNNFVLSATLHSKLCGTINAINKNIGAVLVLAPLSLRKALCHQSSKLYFNKCKQHGPAGPDLAALGSCCRRYVS